MQGVVGQKPGVVEVVLNNLRLKLQQYLAPPRVDTEVTRIERQGTMMDEYDGIVGNSECVYPVVVSVVQHVSHS